MKTIGISPGPSRGPVTHPGLTGPSLTNQYVKVNPQVISADRVSDLGSMVDLGSGVESLLILRQPMTIIRLLSAER